VAFCTTAILAGAQQGETTKREQDKTSTGRGSANPPAPGTTGDPTLAGEGEALVSTDSIGWQALTDNLFISGERGIANPGDVEPEPRRALQFGTLAILPKFDETVVYDDNVFLTDTDEQDDFILRTRAALLADWAIGTSGHRLTAGWDMTRNWFMGGEAKNFVENLASAQLDLNFRKLRFSIGDRYEDRTDPILAVFTAKIERTINTIYGNGGWYSDSDYIEVKAQSVDTQYDSPTYQGFDRDEGLAYAEYGWLLDDELWAFARAGAINRDFDQMQLNDMTGATASVGVRFKRAPTLDAYVRVGARFESFDDYAATDSDDSAVNPDVEARAMWWPTRVDGIDARYVHTTEFSPVSDYEVLDRIEVGWTRLLTGRLRGRTGFGFENVDPSDVADTFWRFSVGAGVTWRLVDFVDLTANWRVRIRQTDVPNGDYTGNQFSVGLAVRL
jgi:hypothetical protein